ncbi:MAG: sigma-54 dependent transcriptional regulator [Byssovorax sp.]
MPTPRAPLLLVTTDPSLGSTFTAPLAAEGIALVEARSSGEAEALLSRRPFTAVLAEAVLLGPGLAGLGALLRSLSAAPVIVLSDGPTVALAVAAVKAGAADLLGKPADPVQVVLALRKAVAEAELVDATEGGGALPPPAATEATAALLGDSRAMAQVKGLIDRAAAGMATVLLRGESGTGKELAARALHAGSARRHGPFVTVHCAALPDTLLESELFGYEKGAFTGALRAKPGRVDLAEGGTLFLDEIGDITPSMQVKLLRLLQERSFERLGGTETLRADVRFVAATHRDLEDMVRKGTFRQDLFYRLDVVPIWLPPLRARRDDIPLLAQRFAAALGAANGRPAVALDASALAALRAQRWPGNVRQLQNFIERLVVLCPTPVITGDDVERETTAQVRFVTEAEAPRSARSEPAAGEVGPLDIEVQKAEREALVRALDRAGGKRQVAARILGISRRTLYNKLSEHGIE